MHGTRPLPRPIQRRPLSPDTINQPRRRQLIQRLRERRMRRRNGMARRPHGTRRLKRKTALAVSVSVMAAGSVIAPAMGDIGVSAAESPAAIRLPAAKLTTSAAMKEALIEEEGVRYTVYADSAGNPTVGVGHLVTARDGLSIGDTIAKDRALDLLEADLEHAEGVVARLAGDTPLYQHEFDALVDLAFNVGEGSLSQANSPNLNRAIAERDHEAIAAELDYIRAGNAVAAGLLYRSERRVAIFVDASYDNPRA